MKKIVQDGENPVLRQTAEEVPADFFGTEKLAAMITDMKDALHAKKNGVALAAPQIAIPYRIFIVRYDRMVAQDPDQEEAPEIGIFINPEIIKTSRKKAEIPEGCLSVDGVFGKTKRYENVTVKAQDEHGKPFTRGAGGLLAQAFQHEIEHLDGIIFTDHATELEHHDEL